jgi:hypothetical protein
VDNKHGINQSGLEDMLRQVNALQVKIKTVMETQSKILNTLEQIMWNTERKSDNRNVMDVMTLLSLPDHLRKTAMAISKVQKATALEVSKITNRSRALESSYLNQLVRMNYLEKTKSSRKVHFHVRGYREWEKL